MYMYMCFYYGTTMSWLTRCYSHFGDTLIYIGLWSGYIPLVENIQSDFLFQLSYCHLACRFI